ncbi:unnamed protein product [Caenorhabditis angaria]|uniref:Uncharacterized protein n=1 Tax=Caenorhabditis angaria TaxID=860376 RepID=A0A9P1I8T7_9PELO|nr:unnamed protein product [Caenorhabditis angaria]
MVGASLLQSDDDSDVPDLEFRGDSNRRRTFFNKTSEDYAEIRHRRKTYKNILSISFIIVFLAVLYFLYTALSRIKTINDEIKELRISSEKFDELNLEISKIQMQLNIFRESSMDGGNSTRKPTTELVYDRLTDISTRLDVLRDSVQKTASSIEDVTSRMSRVENKCLAVCQHDLNSVSPPKTSREQPRRRQAADKKTSTNSEIVFRRND